MANFTNANEIALLGPEAINVAAVTINNGTPTFTLALNGNTGGAAQPGAGPAAFLIGFHNFIVNQPSTTSTTDVFNLSMGTAALTFGEGGATGVGGVGGNTDAAVANSDTIGFFGILGAGLAVHGYETVNINVVDGPALPAFVSIFTPLTNTPDIIYGGILMTPTVGGGEILNVTGPGDLVSLFNTPATSLANIVSSTNNFVINAHEAGILAFGGANALQVNGADSGGIIMVGGVDTNPAGATLTGSTTHWNALAGSTSADVFNGGTGQFSPFIAVQGDVFGTNGGADTVNLAAGHTLNHIDIYGTDGAPYGPATFGLDYNPLPGSVNGFGGTGLYQPGFGGVATGGAPSQFGAMVLTPDVVGFSGGTSASQVMVNNFVTGGSDVPIPTGGDSLTFSVGAWAPGLVAANATFGLPALADRGLVNDHLAGVPTGTDAVLSNPVSAGGIITPQIGGTIPDVIEIAQVEPNATALGQYLHTAGFLSSGVLFPAGFTLPAANNAHMLFAYSDGANVHIADVDLATAAAAAAGTGFGGGMQVVGATDMVELVGVASLSSLNAHNVHFLA